MTKKPAAKPGATKFMPSDATLWYRVVRRGARKAVLAGRYYSERAAIEAILPGPWRAPHFVQKCVRPRGEEVAKCRSVVSLGPKGVTNLPGSEARPDRGHLRSRRPELEE